MEWTSKYIIFLPVPSKLEFGFWMKLSFSIFAGMIVVVGLIVHRRILSFLSRNTGKKHCVKKIGELWLILSTQDRFGSCLANYKYVVGMICNTCAITLNYCTYTNHVGVSPRALYCVVDTSYGLVTQAFGDSLKLSSTGLATHWLKIFLLA